MDNEKEDVIKVYRLGDEPVMVPRSQILWTDRSRMANSCARKRYLETEYDGTGYTSTARNEDLTIGGAVHEGIDLLLQGGSLTNALSVAEINYKEAPPWGDWLLPEQKEILSQDGLHLVKGLVYSFYVNYLPSYLEQYELVEVEEEINWMMQQSLTGKYLVCMSRPDAVLRHKESGRLWHVSHKTAKRFDDLIISKLEVDFQRFSEGTAIEAKFGEPIEGTLYNYLLKGDRRKDESCNLERYTTGLIRPYVYRQSGGSLTPEMVSYNWEWNQLDIKTGQTHKKRLGKGWEKADIYREMDYMTYLEWLREKWVQREGADYLLDAVAGMVPIYWNEFHARRWLTGAIPAEMDWARYVQAVGKKADVNSATTTDVLFPLASGLCFSYNHRCAYYEVCWRGRTPDSLLEDGSMTHREPNHLQEFYEVM